jgi:hypothetical protein
MHIQRSCGIARPLFLALLLSGAGAQAQVIGRAITGENLQKLANGIVGVMAYTVAPDVTTSSLAISNNETSSAGLSMTQVGGGFTWSKETPLYLEGNAAYSRYDPVFVVSEGADARSVPVKWNSVSATGGIGWDFPITRHWVVRPILNLTYGRVVSDVKLGSWWLENNTDVDLSFLSGGKLEAYGLGGSLMFDYEKFTPDADDDIEIRYTNVDLRSHSTGRNLDVVGHAKAESISLWARRRVPTGWGMLFDRPVRYVYEVATTRFLGEEKETGISYMNSVGFGLEADTSARDVCATRWRLVMRYKFGPDLSGWSTGIAISF